MESWLNKEPPCSTQLVIILFCAFSLPVANANAQSRSPRSLPTTGVQQLRVKSGQPEGENQAENSFLHAAASAKSKHNYKEALEYYDKAIAAAPKSTKSLLLRGALLLDYLHEDEKAIADFNKAAQLAPEDSQPIFNRGLAEYNLDKFDLAIKDSTKSIELIEQKEKSGAPSTTGIYAFRYKSAANKLKSPSLQLRAEAYRHLKQYDQALADMTLAINYDHQKPPEHPYWMCRRAHLLQEMGRIEDSKKEYDIVVSHYPSLADGWDGRASVYQKLRDFTSAIADYEKAISLKPEKACYYNDRALAERELGQFDKALESFQLSIARQPSHANHFVNLAELEMDMGDSANARKHAQLGLDAAGKSDDPSNKVSRAKAFSILGQPDRATSEIESLLADADADSDDKAEVLGVRAALSKDKGDLAAALKDYDKSIELAPNDGVYYFKRAEIRKLNEEDELASKDLDQAKSLNYIPYAPQQK